MLVNTLTMTPPESTANLVFGEKVKCEANIQKNNLQMNYPQSIQRQVRNFRRLAVFAMIGAAGLQFATGNARAQTTNAFDVLPMPHTPGRERRMD